MCVGGDDDDDDGDGGDDDVCLVWSSARSSVGRDCREEAHVTQPERHEPKQKRGSFFWLTDVEGHDTE